MNRLITDRLYLPVNHIQRMLLQLNIFTNHLLNIIYFLFIHDDLGLFTLLKLFNLLKLLLNEFEVLVYVVFANINYFLDHHQLVVHVELVLVVGVHLLIVLDISDHIFNGCIFFVELVFLFSELIF